MYGIKDLVSVFIALAFYFHLSLFEFWGPGNFELFVLAADAARGRDDQLFVIPFAKSATTSQHAPVCRNLLHSNRVLEPAVLGQHTLCLPTA